MSPTLSRPVPLAALAVAALAAPAAAYDIGKCRTEAEAAMDRLGVDRSKISEVKTDTMLSGGEQLYVTGINLWLESGTCDGSWVLSFSSRCEFLGTFDRGDCTAADFRR